MHPRCACLRAQTVLASPGLTVADIVSWFDRVGGESKCDVVPGAPESCTFRPNCVGSPPATLALPDRRIPGFQRFTLWRTALGAIFRMYVAGADSPTDRRH